MHTGFHWFLPTGGDGRDLAAGVHGSGIGGTYQQRRGAPRPASLAYLSQVARAADTLGYEAVLTPTGAHCADAWVATATLISQTERLKFLVAFRPGLIEPALAAHMAATFQHLSSGRLLLNVVIGSGAAEQRGYGDTLDHDERYARAQEFLEVVRRSWNGTEFDHHGRFYDLDAALLREPPAPHPHVYLGGSSDAGLLVAARQADVYLTWGEPLAMVREKVDRVRELAAQAGRAIRFGLRIHVITRDTAAQAWADADRLIAGLDPAAIDAGQRRLRSLESVGQRRMLDLHGGAADQLVVAPNLWAGIDEFILSGYPHLEETYAFAEGVGPLLS